MHPNVRVQVSRLGELKVEGIGTFKKKYDKIICWYFLNDTILYHSNILTIFISFENVAYLYSGHPSSRDAQSIFFT